MVPIATTERMLSMMYRKGQRIRQTFSTGTMREGRVVWVQDNEITVEWDRGGFPQILPPEQQVGVEILSR